ncbi:MAG: hypothetical protein LC623_02590, partial [Halobacteriales archaeon]|nr:hypothetical protein [Halobacteriales archaeon]
MKTTLGGNGGASKAAFNDGLLSEQLQWFGSGFGGRGGVAQAQSSCILPGCSLENATWCAADFVVQKACFSTAHPDWVSDFCTDVEYMVQQFLGFEVPLVGTAGSAASGATGSAIPGGDGANGSQGHAGVDMSADIGASGKDGSVGLSCSVTHGEAGHDGRDGG